MTTTTSRVFLVTATRRLDVSEAEKHGRLVVLLPEHPPSPFATEDMRDRIVEAFDREGFDPVDDLLLMAGPNVAMAVAYGLLLTRHNRVRVLIHDARRNSYRERVFEVVSRARPTDAEALK